MSAYYKTLLSFTLLASLGLAGCDSASTDIVERGPIPVEDDHDDHDHDHDAEAGSGRLLVTSATGEAQVFDLEDGHMLESFALDPVPSAVHASAGYRYGVLVNRAGNAVNFIDGGVWQEDHVEHLHPYEAAPVLVDFSLSGSRPTHVVTHGAELAIFFDGDEAGGEPALVQVLSDSHIAAGEVMGSLEYAINMHGAAQPRGEHLYSTVRRGPSLSLSLSLSLPDQVAVYHNHEGEYEQEEALALTCPDLHGSAQNAELVVFGCRDGVLAIEEDGTALNTFKLDNPEELATGLRIGSLYGHEASEQFFGIASAHGSTAAPQIFVVDAHEGEMKLLDWQPEDGARPVAYAFTHEAEQFLILDNLGHLTVIEPHAHDGHTHWEFGSRLVISEEDISTMPEGHSFKMTVSQSGHTVYVSDPIAQHIVVVDLEHGEVDGDIELTFTPATVTWLGIAGEAHGEHDEHDH